MSSVQSPADAGGSGPAGATVGGFSASPPTTRAHQAVRAALNAALTSEEAASIGSSATARITPLAVTVTLKSELQRLEEVYPGRWSEACGDWSSSFDEATERLARDATKLFGRILKDLGVDPGRWRKGLSQTQTFDTPHRYATEMTCHPCGGSGDVQCPTCHGTRRESCLSCGGDGWNSCRSCRGRGEQTVYRNGSSYRARCQPCGGSGRVNCSPCGASGRIPCGPCRASGLVECDHCRATGLVTWSYGARLTVRAQAKVAAGAGAGELDAAAIAAWPEVAWRTANLALPGETLGDGARFSAEVLVETVALKARGEEAELAFVNADPDACIAGRRLGEAFAPMAAVVEGALDPDVRTLETLFPSRPFTAWLLCDAVWDQAPDALHEIALRAEASAPTPTSVGILHRLMAPAMLARAQEAVAGAARAYGGRVRRAEADVRSEVWTTAAAGAALIVAGPVMAALLDRYDFALDPSTAAGRNSWIYLAGSGVWGLGLNALMKKRLAAVTAGASVAAGRPQQQRAAAAAARRLAGRGSAAALGWAAAVAAFAVWSPGIAPAPAPDATPASVAASAAPAQPIAPPTPAEPPPPHGFVTVVDGLPDFRLTEILEAPEAWVARFGCEPESEGVGLRRVGRLKPTQEVAVPLFIVVDGPAPQGFESFEAAVKAACALPPPDLAAPAPEALTSAAPTAPEPQTPPTVTLADTDWRQAPQAWRLARFFPPAAREPEGAAVLDCAVHPASRSPTDCRIEEEGPAGEGFGPAALRAVQELAGRGHYRVAETSPWTAGARVRFQVNLTQMSPQEAYEAEAVYWREFRNGRR